MLWLGDMQRHDVRSTFDSARSHARRRRQLGWLCAVMQLLVVLLSLQISGAAHRVADLVFTDDCASDCGDEGEDSDCPPGCPTCHGCTHAQALYVPRAESILAPAMLDIEPPRVEGDRPPPARELPSIFRPPRRDRFDQT